MDNTNAEAEAKADLLALYLRLCTIEEIAFNFDEYMPELIELEARCVAALERMGDVVRYPQFTLRAERATWKDGDTVHTAAWVTARGGTPAHTRIANPASIVLTFQKTWRHGLLTEMVGA